MSVLIRFSPVRHSNRAKRTSRTPPVPIPTSRCYTNSKLVGSTSNDKGKGKGKAKVKRPAQKNSPNKYIVSESSDIETEAEATEKSGSEDDGEGSNLSEAIVESHEDEEKDARLAMKKPCKLTIVNSNDEIMEDTSEEKEVLFGTPNEKLTKEELKFIPHFLPSTKMKVVLDISLPFLLFNLRQEMMDLLKKLSSEHPSEKAC
ncbi:hypothetical protein B0H16DRAFT_1478313 [Mycena metata]|uniref:Uncharacterized protein n=1 Tax=Mycena metata TaxID=1033252 RepID=A0AAD7H7J4_9AGAR|nr:hypothetical protein B0H16DRAFT_1478313 [Mycena metata]